MRGDYPRAWTRSTLRAPALHSADEARSGRGRRGARPDSCHPARSPGAPARSVGRLRRGAGYVQPARRARPPDPRRGDRLDPARADHPRARRVPPLRSVRPLRLPGERRLSHGGRASRSVRGSASRNLDNLASLRLGPADLERKGLHPELGPVTLGQLLATWVAHDLDHVAQVARVMARRCREDVGPWRAFLRILQ